MYLKFLEVSKKTGVSVKKILDTFWYLLKEGAVENNELVKKIGVSKNALNQVKKDLTFYLNSPSKTTSLKKNMIQAVSKLYKHNYLVEEGIFLTLVKTDVYKEAVKLLNNYKINKPSPQRKYDQFFATVETVGKRVALLDFFEDIKGKRLLFLGDDDFTSIPTASRRSANEITVLDIDERILQAIEIIAKAENLPIINVKHDLRRPIPSNLKNRFDTVFTDPPYTPSGIKLFVSRAIEALDKKNQTARIYICFGNSDRAKERFLPIQKIFTEAGLMMRWVFDKFNRYEKAESIGNSSSLYIVEITPQTKLLVSGIYEKPIYTNS